METKYKQLRGQVIWAITHYGLVDTDDIFKHLKCVIKEIDDGMFGLTILQKFELLEQQLKTTVHQKDYSK